MLAVCASVAGEGLGATLRTVVPGWTHPAGGHDESWACAVKLREARRVGGQVAANVKKNSTN